MLFPFETEIFLGERLVGKWKETPPLLAGYLDLEVRERSARQTHICEFGTVSSRRRANRWHAASGRNLDEARSPLYLPPHIPPSCFTDWGLPLIRSFALTFMSVFHHESRNCLFSGTPGTSWQRQWEIDSLLSFLSFLLPQSVYHCSNTQLYHFILW